MKYSMTEQDKCNFLIQVTTWAGLTVFTYCLFHLFYSISNYLGSWTFEKV